MAGQTLHAVVSAQAPHTTTDDEADGPIVSPETQRLIAEQVQRLAAHGASAQACSVHTLPPGPPSLTDTEEALHGAAALVRTLAELCPTHAGAVVQLQTDALAAALAMALDDLDRARLAITSRLPLPLHQVDQARTAADAARGLLACWMALADASRSGATLKLDADALSCALDRVLSAIDTAAAAMAGRSIEEAGHE